MANLNLISIALLLLGCFSLSKGLQCFDCTYSLSGSTAGGDPACKSAPIPDSLVKQCAMGTNTTSELGGSGPGPVPHLTTGCLSVGINGKLLGQPMKSMLRLCFPILDGIKTCKTQTRAKWAQGEDDISKFIAALTGGAVSSYSADTVIDGCFCTQDKCNTEPIPGAWLRGGHGDESILLQEENKGGEKSGGVIVMSVVGNVVVLLVGLTLTTFFRN